MIYNYCVIDDIQRQAVDFKNSKYMTVEVERGDVRFSSAPPEKSKSPDLLFSMKFAFRRIEPL